MATLFNSVMLNALVAAGFAVVVSVTAMIPAIRRRPGLRHALWIVVLLKLVTPPLFEVPIVPAWQSDNLQPVSELETVSVRDFGAAPPMSPNRSRTEVAAPNIRADHRPADSHRGWRWVWNNDRADPRGRPGVKTSPAAAEERDERRTLEQYRLAGGRTHGTSCRAERLCGCGECSAALLMRRTGPLIVMPHCLAAELTDNELVCVMSHEIAHCLRRDHWMNLCSLIVAALCWWNPVAWWARRGLRIAREQCCDAR